MGEWRIVLNVNVEAAFSFKLIDLVEDLLPLFAEGWGDLLAFSDSLLDGLVWGPLLFTVTKFLMIFIGFFGFLVAESFDAIDALEDFVDDILRDEFAVFEDLVFDTGNFGVLEETVLVHDVLKVPWLEHQVVMDEVWVRDFFP